MWIAFRMRWARLLDPLGEDHQAGDHDPSGEEEHGRWVHQVLNSRKVATR